MLMDLIGVRQLSVRVFDHLFGILARFEALSILCVLIPKHDVIDPACPIVSNCTRTDIKTTLDQPRAFFTHNQKLHGDAEPGVSRSTLTPETSWLTGTLSSKYNNAIVVLST